MENKNVRANFAFSFRCNRCGHSWTALELNPDGTANTDQKNCHVCDGIEVEKLD